MNIRHLVGSVKKIDCLKSSIDSCNSSSLSLIDIVYFDTIHVVNLMIFRTLMLGKGLHIVMMNVSFSSPTNVRSHSPLPCDLSIHFGSLRTTVSLTIFKTYLIWRSFHILIRNDSFPSPTDVGSSNYIGSNQTLILK